MMPSKRTLIAGIACLLFCGLTGAAQESGPAAAKHELQLGEQARETGDFDGAVKHFRAAVDAAPDSLEAHEQFTSAMVSAEAAKLRRGSRELKDVLAARKAAEKQVGELYQKWAKEHPDKVIYRYFVVNYGHPFPDPAALPEYKRMTETDPDFAPPYDDVAAYAAMQGDDAAFLAYELKAADLRPDDIGYRTRYIGYFFENEPEKYPPLAEDFARRFPKDASIELIRAADVVPTPQEKARYLQHALDMVSPAQRAWVVGALCAAYAAFAPEKAAELAAKEVREADANASLRKAVRKQFEEFATHYDAFARARQLLDQGKVDEAAAVAARIQPVKAIPFAESDPLLLASLQSEILSAQGKPQQAYQMFVAAAADAPSARFLHALEPLATKVNKSPEQVRADILTAALVNAKPLQDFEFPDLAGGKKNTADYRGKVLYLNLWAPD